MSFAGLRRRRRVPFALRAASLAVSLTMLGAGCGTAGSPASQGGSAPGVLKIAMSAGNIPLPDTAPDQGYEGYRFVGNNIYDGLTRLNLDQSKTLPTPQPALAQSWSVSADKLTWTFHLRHGVLFQDGTPFNADAVIFNFNRDDDRKFKYYDQTDATRLGVYFQHIASYKKIDDYTVAITTTGPYAFLLDDMLTVFIASPAAVMKYGNAHYLDHAIGTGPFKMTKYIDGQVMVLTANKHYWRDTPKLKEIILYPEPEPASRMASLQSGDVNWAEVPAPDAIAQLRSQGYQVFMDNHHPGAIMPTFNFYRPPFNDIKVREALNYALNRKATVAVINGTGLAANQYVYPGHPNYVVGDPGYYYDPGKAKKLLNEAGYGPGKKPLNIRFAYPSSGSGNMFPGPMMEQLQQDFKAVNVNVTLVPMEWDTFLTIRYSGGLKPGSQYSNLDMVWSSPAAGMLPTGYQYSYDCTVGGFPNIGGWCDPRVNKDFAAAATSFSPATQNRYLTAMLKVGLDDAAFLYWVYDRNLRVMSPSVHGYVQAQSWWVDFTTISVS